MLRLASILVLMLLSRTLPATVGAWYSVIYQGTGDRWNGYLPLVKGVPGPYDSADTTVIDAHLKMLAEAKIDFLLLDLTNHIGTGFVLERARKVASRLVLWNLNHRADSLHYAIAIGATQWSNDPADIESEAKSAWDWFVATYGVGNYFHWDGKPLLVASDGGVRAKYEAMANKTNSGRFTMKWWAGNVQARDYPQARWGDYVGWGFTEGALANPEAMVAMPGWNNNVGWTPVSRYLNGVEGDYYRMCWERILENRPRMAVIASFNEFAEENGIEPSDTKGVKGAPGSEPWSTPSFYWDMSRQYIAKYKSTVPPDSNKVRMLALNDFRNQAEPGFVEYRRDHPRQGGTNGGVLAVQGADGQFAAAAAPFMRANGRYDIGLTTLAEAGGQSTYRLRINGIVIGSFVSPVVAAAQPFNHVWKDIPVHAQDSVQVESNVSGKAMGRWSLLTFTLVQPMAALRPDNRRSHALEPGFLRRDILKPIADAQSRGLDVYSMDARRLRPISRAYPARGIYRW